MNWLKSIICFFVPIAFDKQRWKQVILDMLGDDSLTGYTIFGAITHQGCPWSSVTFYVVMAELQDSGQVVGSYKGYRRATD